MTLSIKELADKYKLQDIGTCNCGGYPTRKFSNGEYTLSWRIHKYVFKMKRRNETLKQWTAIKYLSEYLENLFDGK